MSLFGKSFATKAEANRELKKRGGPGMWDDGLRIRKISKGVHPRRKKPWHVGTFMDFLDFA